MYIDTHCHLNFKAFEGDYDATIMRAKSLRVEKIINVGSNFKTSKKAIDIASQNDGVYATIGLHPIHIKDEEFDAEFEKLVQDKKVVAIGETGLDYYYSKDDKEKQKEVFEKHIKLANVSGKPIILHNRDAGEDLLSMLTAQGQLPKGVMHCFSENWEFAQVILDMGFLISFTGIITFSKNYEIYKVIENTPLEKIMIETDSPYLTPEPYRGKRNEPAFVIEVAKKIAAIKKIPLEKVAEQTSKNAIELFKLK
jgi:TatD DNase family protein